MKENKYVIISDNKEVYFSGTYWECNDWLEVECKDVSTPDDDCEIWIYRNNEERLHLFKENTFFEKLQG